MSELADLQDSTRDPSMQDIIQAARENAPVAGIGDAEAPVLSRAKLGRMDLSVALRIGLCLRENTGLGKTRLATMCRIKYPTCKRYLECMGILGLVTGDKHVRLTELGYAVLR